MENKIEIYQGSDGQTQIEVRFEGDTFWLPLQQISELFQRDKSVISRHIKNIYKEGELIRDATVAKNATVQMEGKRKVEREIEFYNLDLILSVGYRVNSKQGTQFRIWATKRLKDYLIQGYTINENRLAQKPTLEEKAATLLYLIVKNHGFVDGNKRIAAACFLLFLQHNMLLHNRDGNPIISNDALASLTLFIASSKPEEMDTVKKLVISVLNRNRT